MRLLVRCHPRAPIPALPWKTAVPARSRSGSAGEPRREWIEALFDNHLPRGIERRESAIAVLASDGEVWRLLHQARHSMSETTATIERLAARAVAQFEDLRAA